MKKNAGGFVDFIVAFPWDRTKKFSFPGVPLSRDKGRSKNLGTNSSVPGQNELKNFKKMTRFPVFGHHFPDLEHPFPVLEQCFLF